MSGTLKVGGKTLATHDTNTNIAKIQLGSTSDVVLTDSQGNNVLSESGGTVTLTADEANVGSNALVVGSSGNVGIGTSSPTSQLHIDPATDNIYGNGLRVSRAATAGQNIVINYRGGSANYIATDSVFSNPNHRFFTSTDGSTITERMIIDSSGNVGIGTSSSYGGMLNFLTTASRITGFTTRPSSNITYNAADFQNSSGTGVGGIGVTSSSTQFSTSSDYRLKENITEITDGITRVKQLNPSRFNFIADPDIIVDGFIAHEVQGIVPEAISGEKDAVNEDGSIRPQGIDQSKLVPLLTAALQEAITLIESQQSQIDALTARIEALETPAE